MNEQIKVGNKVRIILEAKVVRVSDAHGLCYQLEIPKRDYNHERRIFVDHNEFIFLNSNRIKIEDGKRIILLDDDLRNQNIRSN